jgi:catechol 2,3-dioxygenase-like lactoylglutathione lyase family enzyme
MYRHAMIDHIGIRVSNLERSIAFYTKALAPLGFELVMKWESFAGFGVGGKAEFWIDGREAPKETFHVAFRASGRQIVRDFFQAALAAGGTDNGAPGPRPHYHEHYYGGFIHDPDGHNIEAVCHEPFLG